MTYSNERTVQFPGSEGRVMRGPGATSELAEARAASSRSAHPDTRAQGSGWGQ
jgi:hypothetical protein